MIVTSPLAFDAPENTTTSRTLPVALPTAACCTPTPPLHADLKALLDQYDVNAFAASIKVYATKP